VTCVRPAAIASVRKGSRPTFRGGAHIIDTTRSSECSCGVQRPVEIAENMIDVFESDLKPHITFRHAGGLLFFRC